MKEQIQTVFVGIVVAAFTLLSACDGFGAISDGDYATVEMMYRSY